MITEPAAICGTNSKPNWTEPNPLTCKALRKKRQFASPFEWNGNGIFALISKPYMERLTKIVNYALFRHFLKATDLPEIGGL